MDLMLIAAVAYFTELVEEDPTCESVSCLSSGQTCAGSLAQFQASHPFQGKRVRPSRPSSRKAIASSFCLGYADKLLRIADAVVVPAFVEVASLRISGQLSTMRPVLMVPPMKGIMMAGGFMPCSRYNLRDLKFRKRGANRNPGSIRTKVQNPP